MVLTAGMTLEGLLQVGEIFVDFRCDDDDIFTAALKTLFVLFCYIGYGVVFGLIFIITAYWAILNGTFYWGE